MPQGAQQPGDDGMQRRSVAPRRAMVRVPVQHAPRREVLQKHPGFSREAINAVTHLLSCEIFQMPGFNCGPRIQAVGESGSLPNFRVLHWSTIQILGRIPAYREGYTVEGSALAMLQGHEVPRVFYVSHQWLASHSCTTECSVVCTEQGLPDDEENTKAANLVDFAMLCISEKLGYEHSGASDAYGPDVFFWIDYACLARSERKTGMLALPLYLACCNCGLLYETQRDRAWLRAEKMMLCALLPTNSIFILPHVGLRSGGCGLRWDEIVEEKVAATQQEAQWLELADWLQEPSEVKKVQTAAVQEYRGAGSLIWTQGPGVARVSSEETRAGLEVLWELLRGRCLAMVGTHNTPDGPAEDVPLTLWKTYAWHFKGPQKEGEWIMLRLPATVDRSRHKPTMPDPKLVSKDAAGRAGEIQVFDGETFKISVAGSLVQMRWRDYGTYNNGQRGTPLAAAAIKGKQPLIKSLLDKHTSVDGTWEDVSALYWAGYYSHIDCVEALLQGKADPTRREIRECCFGFHYPLYGAISGSCVPAVRALLAAKGDPTYASSGPVPEFALEVAAGLSFSGRGEIIQALLAGRSDPNMTSDNPAVIRVMTIGDYFSVNRLLAFGANLGAADSNKQNFYHHCARMKKPLMALVDVRAGCALDRWGMTPMMIAACHGSTAYVVGLLNARVGPNQPGVSGSTAADFALGMSQLGTVAALLERGGRHGELRMYPTREFEATIRIAAQFRRKCHAAGVNFEEAAMARGEYFVAHIEEGGAVGVARKAAQTLGHPFVMLGDRVTRINSVVDTTLAMHKNLTIDKGSFSCGLRYQSHQPVSLEELALGANEKRKGSVADCQMTLLHVAAAGGHMKLLQGLVQAGVNICAVCCSRCSRTPLYFAVTNMRIEAALFLIGSGGHRMGPACGMWNIVHTVSQSGCSDILAALYELQGQKLVQEAEQPTAAGDRALHIAARGGHQDVLCCLLEYKVDPWPMGSDGPALSIAGMEDHSSVCVTIARYLWPDCDEDQRTPLHRATQACSRNFAPLVRCVVVGIGGRGTSPFRSLHDPIVEGILSLVSVMLACRADVNLRDSQGATPLLLACHRNYYQVCVDLLEAQASPSAVTKRHTTPMMVSASLEEDAGLSITLLLLSCKASPNAADADGCTVLMHACTNANRETVRELLAAGCSPNAQDQRGWSALYLVCKKGNPGLVSDLLEAGSVVTTQCLDGDTPVLAAARRGDEAVLTCLVERSADVTTVNSEFQTPLLVAAEHDLAGSLRLLVSQQANPDWQDPRTGMTALMVAAREGFQQSVIALLALKADARLKDRDGWSASVWAAFSGHTFVVDTLTGTSAGQGQLVWDPFLWQEQEDRSAFDFLLNRVPKAKQRSQPTGKTTQITRPKRWETSDLEDGIMRGARQLPAMTDLLGRSTSRGSRGSPQQSPRAWAAPAQGSTEQSPGGARTVPQQGPARQSPRAGRAAPGLSATPKLAFQGDSMGDPARLWQLAPTAPVAQVGKAKSKFGKSRPRLLHRPDSEGPVLSSCVVLGTPRVLMAPSPSAEPPSTVASVKPTKGRRSKYHPST
mmetsp:Transcript_58930/g.157523  ORF Transcript_58930/g.157523 Transcript_58930/m.157523 type:complete len:1561 (-) Transcript_58930:54-4736(-)